MIDTVRFNIPATPEYAAFLRKNAVEFHKKDHSTNTTQYQVYTSQVFLPSYNNYLSLFLPQGAQYIQLELSLAKYCYGHNVYLLYPQDVLLVLTSLYLDLDRVLPGFPHLEVWKIIRLDLCYSWKFAHEYQARSVMDIVQSIDYPRQKRRVYDSSVMWVGSSYSSKFYLKADEFQKHDYSRIKKVDPDKANLLLNTAGNIVRYEVTLRNKYLLDKYGRDIDSYKLLTNTDLIMKEIKEKFSRFQGFLGTVKMTRPTQALDQLLLKYKPTKAIQLYQFWLSWYQSGQNHRQVIKDNYHRSTVYRHIRDLRLAGVGVYVPEYNLPTLQIPSPLAVN